MGSDRGGGFLNGFHSTATLTNSTLSGNTASSFGGGFYNQSENAAVGITESTILGNLAVFGGGFFNFLGTVGLINSTLSGNKASLLGGGFANSGPGPGAVSLINSTLSNNSAALGGGFLNDDEGRVSLTNSTVSGNSAEYDGGGFFNESRVSLTNSTLSGNSAGDFGGGFANYARLLLPTGEVTLTNCTVSDNSATTSGGGFSNRGTGGITLTNCTLSGNSAPLGGGLFSSEILYQTFFSAVTNLTNTIVANSTGEDCVGTLAINDYNIIEDNSCNPALSGDPTLGPLADNGGPTLTHALLPGSTAIDAGVDCAGPPVFGIDQRGFVRDAFCDIGAYEFNALEIGAKIGVKRGGQWFLDRNGNGLWDGCAVDGCFVFGALEDRPVAGDWNGDGFAEIGVLRNGHWFLDNGNGQWDGCGALPLQDACFTFGAPGDQPVAGDWNGDGFAEIGVLRNGHWFLDNGNGEWDGCGALPLQDACFTFGAPGDQPVAGDWNGDGFAEIGVLRNGHWFLDNGNGEWDGCGALPLQDACFTCGAPGDQPVAGDWNGDGFAGIGVKQGSDWFLDRNANDFWDGCNIDSCVFGWGAPEDVPISGLWK
ncbi:MAG: choice-of-anchor Q domain-containing protein [Candidatus Competibacteraceae bacterium]